MSSGGSRLDRKGYAARLFAILLFWVPASVDSDFVAKSFIVQPLFHLAFVILLCGVFALGSISARRLHDIGISGLPAWIVASLLSLNYLRFYIEVGMEFGLLPALSFVEQARSALEAVYDWIEIVIGVLILLLGLIPGERSTNRFGAPHYFARSLRKQERFGLRQAKLRRRYPNRPVTRWRSRVFRIRELHAAGLLHVSILWRCLTVLGYAFGSAVMFAVLRPQNWGKLAHKPQAGLTSLILLAVTACLAGLLLHAARRLQQKIIVYDALDIVNRGARFILFLRPFRSDRTVSVVPRRHGSTAFYPPKSMTDILKTFGSSWLLFWRLFGKQHWNMATHRIDVQDFLVKELQQLAPLVALGIDDIGIAKLAATDETWQEKFRSLADAASCILFVPADSTGSLAEFEAILTAYLNKTIFVVLPQEERLIRRFNFWSLDHAAAWKSAMTIMQEKLSHQDKETLHRYASYRNGLLLTFEQFPKVKDEQYIYANSLRALVKEIMEKQGKPAISAALTSR